MAADVLFSGVADAQVSSDLREYLAGYGCNGALTAAVVAAGDALRNYAADATVRRGAEGPVGLFLAALPVWLMGGCEMADGKGTARVRRSRPAQIIGSQRTQNMGWQRNRVNVALPLSMIKAVEPAAMRAGDWISLAGLVVSAIGFSVVIRELIRIAHASEASRVSHRVSQGKADSLAGGSSSPDTGRRISRT
jgi:hypothetical protein